MTVSEDDYLEKYYLSDRFVQNLRLPPRPERHHYRFEFRLKSDKYFARVRKTIRSIESLRRVILNSKPIGIFFTPTEWLDPVYLRKTRGIKHYDILLSSPLYFDIDCTSLRPPTLRNAAEHTRRLVASIEQLFGRKPDWVCFSGRRGFHIYYWDWDTIPRDFQDPRERIREFRLSRKTLSKVLLKAGSVFDLDVTSDPFRIMRLPGSLHSETLGLVKLIDAENYL